MRYRKNIFKDKSFLAMAGITILSIGAIVGGVVLSKNSDEPESSYIADLNESGTDDLAANNGATKASKDSNSEKATTPKEQTSTLNNEETTTEDSKAAGSESQTTGSDLSPAGTGVSKFTFSADSVLVWPVDTNDIIIDYSPETTVYFATLDKYKTSNAISIRSEIGTPVYAAASGTVCDIGYNEEIGNSVSLDLGSNYTLQYGQIKDIQVSEGDVVNEGDLICYVANPTKYYTVEGPNLYLKLTSDESTVDPLDYLDFKE